MRLLWPTCLVTAGTGTIAFGSSAGQSNAWWFILAFAGGVACGISVSWAWRMGREAQLDEHLTAHAVLEQRRQNARWS